MTRSNGSCSASTCTDTPIAFVIEVAGEGDPPTVRLTDPSGVPVESAEPPTEVDSTTHEWLWRAGYGDPIGDYQVVFAADNVQIAATFRVVAVDEAFGVVQNLAAAVAEQDWVRAATIDSRFEDDLLGDDDSARPDKQYAGLIDQHWITSDPAGEDMEGGTQIVGAFVAAHAGAGYTEFFCERWIVFPGDTTMRSSAFPTRETQRRATMPGAPDVSEVEAWVATHCSE